MKKVTATKHHFPVLMLICSKPGTNILTHLLPVQQIYHLTMTGIQGKPKLDSHTSQCLFTVQVHFPRKSFWETGWAPQPLFLFPTLCCPVLQQTDSPLASRRQKINLTKASLGSKKPVASVSLLCHNKHFLWQTPSAEIEQTVFHISLNPWALRGQINFASRTYSNTTASSIFWECLVLEACDKVSATKTARNGFLFCPLISNITSFLLQDCNLPYTKRSMSGIECRICYQVPEWDHISNQKVQQETFHFCLALIMVIKGN